MKFDKYPILERPFFEILLMDWIVPAWICTALLTLTVGSFVAGFVLLVKFLRG